MDVLQYVEKLRAQLVEQPNHLGLLDQAAMMALKAKRPDIAAELYQQYISFHENHAGAQFNCAYYLRAAGHYDQAISHYNQALALNISGPEEVYTNIGVIYNEGLLDNNLAKQAFERALKISPNYVPALYNLANCYEQDGDREKAKQYFQAVIAHQPNNIMAHVRLADVAQVSNPQDPLITKLKAFFDASNCPLNERIDVGFALGKLLDECQCYEEAWEYYSQANKLNATTMPAWSASQQAALVQEIKHQFGLKPPPMVESSTMQPVFICGMYRSGSTLLEQMLGAHDAITNGGELEYFPRLWQQIKGQGITQFCAQKSAQDFASVGAEYIKFVQQRFPEAKLFTDKRPDNLWLLGLIKRCLPNAKIIVTQRDILDNCLSVYFTRLNAQMNYANSIDHIMAFFELERELLAHWQSIFGDDLHVVDYDALVHEPKRVLGDVLSWLKLPWQDQCLAFHQRDNTVRTASVWQVRQPLYQRSSGRHQHYSKFLPSW